MSATPSAQSPWGGAPEGGPSGPGLPDPGASSHGAGGKPPTGAPPPGRGPRRPRWPLVLVLVLVLVGAAVVTAVLTTHNGTNSGSGATPPPNGALPAECQTASSPAPDPQITADGVAAVDMTLVDTSRTTPAHNGSPRLPCRVLHTVLFYPTGQTGQRLPLIVFAHGFAGSAQEDSPLLEAWAQGGYAVAAPDFPLSQEAAPGGPTDTDLGSQPGDVSYVINQFADGAIPGLPITVDPDKIAVAGHSLGAVTVLIQTLDPALNNNKVKAVIAVAGAAGDELPFSQPAFPQQHPPILLIAGMADMTVPYTCSLRLYATVPPPVTLVTLFGAGHLPFRTVSGLGDQPRFQSVVVQTSEDFLAGALDNDPSAQGRLKVDGNRAMTSMVTDPRTSDGGTTYGADAPCKLSGDQ